MQLTAKASINLKEGTVQLEGSEQFVEKYLDEFKDLIKPSISLLENQDSSETELLFKAIAKQNTVPKSKKIRKIKDIKPEEFDMFPREKPSLEAFLLQKKPGASAKEKIIVIAYYIKHTLNVESFSEGNIEFVYRTLKLTGKPVHLRQMLTDLKNKDIWVENISENWKISRVGEKFVEEKMPFIGK
jgi:hypothetical protein